ncbi:hypothetical protein STEG23_012317, partial [Scotinomys teguina]
MLKTTSSVSDNFLLPARCRTLYFSSTMYVYLHAIISHHDDNGLNSELSALITCGLKKGLGYMSQGRLGYGCFICANMGKPSSMLGKGFC